MTWVKVCGLTDRHDVVAVCAAGADAIGLVNVPSSPRFVTVEQAAALAAAATVPAVLLTVDLAPEATIEVLRRAGVAGLQPYGEHAAAAAVAAQQAGFLVLYPQHAVPDLELTGVPGIPLLDTPSPVLGGSGRTFDWELLRGVEQRFVLAGGLGPDNIEEAVRRIRPWGVDASSRLEWSPGRKDHSIVADFIRKAKAA
jgi:phosphoribosylanthranilate isomerase